MIFNTACHLFTRVFFHRLVFTDNDDADFENGRLGMWSNSRSDNLNWRFHRSYTQTINTGPSADHTNGLGLYLCIASIRRISAGKHVQIKQNTASGLDG